MSILYCYIKDMKKTYITRLPDHTGSFLAAGRIISELGGTIVRVSYNKAVDVHTLFIEVNASRDIHKEIERKLNEKGYISGLYDNSQMLMAVLRIERKKDNLIPVLEILDRYNISLSYINYAETNAPVMEYRIGFLTDNTARLREMIDEISRICEIRILDHNATDGQLDGTVFYVTFANRMREILGLCQENTNLVLIEANKLMQMMDMEKKIPVQTFDYILRFAEFVKKVKGGNFNARINSYRLEKDISLYCIEPPCGSNTYIIEHGNELMFVDCGFACFRSEMETLYYQLFPDYEKKSRNLMLTHSDVDHVGQHAMFDRIYLSDYSYRNFVLQAKGEPDFREQHPRHNPFCVLTKMISGYIPPDIEKCVVVGEKKDDEVLSRLGEVEFAGRKFEFLEGNGGHVKGDTIIVCPELKLIFTGDIYVNIKGFSYEQKQFNRLAPYLMSGVDTKPDEARKCRELIREKYKGYMFCPGHGAVQV